MAVGFFNRREKERIVQVNALPSCGACGLYKLCKSPKMKPYGRGERKILVVGEAPGENEDLRGRPFVGKAGSLLRETLEGVGVDLDRDCWTTNALICHPKNNEIKNLKMIDWCRPNLINTIKDLQPESIVLLGAKAVRSLIGYLWKPDVGGMERWVGWRIPVQSINTWVCPIWHPSYVLRIEKAQEADIARMLFAKYLGASFKLQGRPWKKVPDYRSKVEVILDPDVAATRIGDLRGGSDDLAAFDYETNMLKPDSKEARIYSCSISNGKTTIAYPWHGRAIDATKDFLTNDIGKIASNAKFEERWTRRLLGFGVNNWWWDTMLAAHVLDNRPDITSIKFLAFAMLGFGAYSGQVDSFFQSKGGCNSKNRIHELAKNNLHNLLLYNGLDSLLEFKVAKLQAKKLGFI